MSFAPPSARRLLPDLLLLIVAIIWGGSYLATQDLAAASSAAAVMCARFVPAALILLCVNFARPRVRLRDSTVPGIVLGTLRAATIALETIGVTLTSATNAGLIIALSILFTPMLESALTKRRMPPSLIASILLALIGITLLVSGQGFAGFNLGDGLMLVAAATRALLGVAEARFTVGRNSDVLGLTTVEILFGAVIFAIWGGNSLMEHIPGFSAANWLAIAYLCLGCTIFAFLGSSGQRNTPRLHAPECSSARSPGGHSLWECSLAEIELERSDTWVPLCSSLQRGGVHVRNSAGAGVAWPARTSQQP